MTVVSDYRALLSNYTWTPGRTGIGLVLTYDFLTAPTAAFQGTTGFHALTDAEKATVRNALAQWSAQSGLTFVESNSPGANIVFGFASLPGTGEAGDGAYPFTGTAVTAGQPTVGDGTDYDSSAIRFDTGYEASSLFSADFPAVALHEIGHTLGFKHPFDTAAGPDTLVTNLDNVSETIMSYTYPPGPRPSHLGPLDIQAAQAEFGTKVGASHPFGQIWATGTQAMTVFGDAAHAQTLFGSGGNDTFYSLGSGDAISGGSGNDTIYLTGKPAEVDGGGGTNIIYTGLAYEPAIPVGGSGTDLYRYVPASGNFQTYNNVAALVFTNGIYTAATASFAAFDPAASTAPISVTGSNRTLTVAGGVVTVGAGNGNDITVTGSATVTTSSLGQETLRLLGLANTVQANGTDTIVAGAGLNSVFAGGNPTTILGGSGGLTVYGGAGPSTVLSGSGGLTFLGGTGSATVVGRGAANTVVGGSGGGTYFGGGNGTIIAGIGPALSVLVGADNDKLYSAGSAGDLFGAEGANVLMDGNDSTGNDVFFGGGGTGAETFVCGEGNDLIGLGQGSNAVTLGAGTDVVFASANPAATATISAGTGSALIAMNQPTDLVIAAGSTQRNFLLYGFNAGTDRITLSGYGSSAVSTLLAGQVDSNGSMTLNLPDQTAIALVGVGHLDAGAVLTA